MCAATTPPSRMPPNPGAGVTGRSVRPSAPRRVGTMGREWKTSNSARITGAAYWRDPPPQRIGPDLRRDLERRAAGPKRGSDERPQGGPQVPRPLLDLVLVDRVLAQQITELGDALAQVIPLLGVHAVRRRLARVDGHRRLDHGERALAVAPVVLEPVGSHEDRAQQLGAPGAVVVLGVELVGVGDLVEQLVGR